MSRADDNVILALRVAIRWRRLKRFCRDRSTCIGCPYFVTKRCALSSDETILFKIADAAQRYLIEHEIDD